MSNSLLELGRLTIGAGVKQAVSVSKELGDAKDMTKVRKAPVPGSLKTTVSTPAEAIQARDAVGPGTIKPIKIPDPPTWFHQLRSPQPSPVRLPPEKSGGLIKEANPVAAIYRILKASRGVVRAGKFLAKHPGMADALGGVPGAVIGYAVTPALQRDLTPSNMRNARLANMVSGYLTGRGMSRFTRGMPSHPLAGIEAGLLSGIISNLWINKTDAQEQAALALPSALEQAGKSVETAASAQGEAVGRKLLLAAGILAAGGLGATGYQAYRDRKQDTARKGTIRVTLPTKRVGDTESTVDMPLNVLSNEAYKGIMRDTRRRVRSENKERTQRRGLAMPAMQAGADMYDSFATPA